MMEEEIRYIINDPVVRRKNHKWPRRLMRISVIGERIEAESGVVLKVVDVFHRASGYCVDVTLERIIKRKTLRG